MSSAKRRINSTGRKRIGRECIEIDLLDEDASGPLRAKVNLKLANADFPDSAEVALEAYHRSSGMRFQLGTVGAPNIPPSIELSEVDRTGSVLFRLKVIDTENEPGKLLGSAERIKPKSDEDGESRRSIFPISYRNLRHDTWKVEIEPGDRPMLIINNQLPGFSHKLQENALLQGMILPAALRFVLQQLAQTADDSDEEEDSWRQEWLEYCAQELGVEGDPLDLEEEKRKDWIDDAVMRFCENAGFVERIRKESDYGHI